MNNKIELTEINSENKGSLISNIKIDGFHSTKMISQLSFSRGNKTAIHIFNNAKQAAAYFANPKLPLSSSKILCLGKVQSGKTAFFISSIALAFDNGFDLCVIFGGTKNALLDQTFERLEKDFYNNEKVRVALLKSVAPLQIKQWINEGLKVILVVLKNVSSLNSNLYEANTILGDYAKIPTIIIDDESDEHTPGAPLLKSKNPRAGITHDVIDEIIQIFSNVTMMFVTATPQANLLLSTIDSLTPDYAVLIEAGDDYTGGDAFHDISSNKHVVEIADTDDFRASIPESFKQAYAFFLIATSVMHFRKNNEQFSMLVHPSGLTRVHRNVVEKMTEGLDDYKVVLKEKNHPAHNEYKRFLLETYTNNFSQDFNFDDIFLVLTSKLDHYKVYEYNTTIEGKRSIEERNYDKNIKYKIFVGGNMLGRGVTLPNLCVTYMYRDAKVSAIDTLYQRARWMGYKKKYFDICRVYMTKDLKEKFIAIADSERDLWVSLNEFLATQIDLKAFTRIFTLPHEKLMLTRKTVSKTIVLERVKPGYTYDRSLAFRQGDVELNNVVLEDFLRKYGSSGKIISFSTSGTQNHLLIEARFTDIYNDFLFNYNFPRNSKIGPLTFRKIYSQVIDGTLEDEINVVVMRYPEGQYRSTNFQGTTLMELPQGYDSGSGYPGDKHLVFNKNSMQLQIHMVYVNKETKDIIPLLAFDNPMTSHTIRYATGDAFYDNI